MATTISADTLLSETKQQRHERFTNQLYHAGARGLLQGTAIALLSGYFLSYKYNHGLNKAYFRNVYKVWWFVGWGIVGVTFATDTAKLKISKQAAIEDEIKRARYLEQELNKGQNK